MVHGNRILNADEADGVVLKLKEKEDGIIADLLIEEGKKIENPVYLCFGILPTEGRQEIVMGVCVEEGAEVEVITHCIFPNAVKVVHKMYRSHFEGKGLSRKKRRV